MDFAITADYRIKIKEWEKIDKYMDLARELETQWNIQLTVMPNVIGKLETVPKRLKRRIELLKIGLKIEISVMLFLKSISFLKYPLKGNTLKELRTDNIPSEDA